MKMLESTVVLLPGFRTIEPMVAPRQYFDIRLLLEAQYTITGIGDFDGELLVNAIFDITNVNLSWSTTSFGVPPPVSPLCRAKKIAAKISSNPPIPSAISDFGKLLFFLSSRFFIHHYILYS